MSETFDRPSPLVPLGFTGERLTSEIGGEIESEHFHRYLYARELCRGKDVLDVAAGEGYGSALLAQVARSVAGLDIAPEAVEHARRSYRRDNLRFFRGDARHMEVKSASIDVVVSFETIEHFAEHEQFLQEVRRVLRPAGLFLVSTPDRNIYSPAGISSNPYHVRELTQDEFRCLLSSHFQHVHWLLQRPITGSVLLHGSGAAFDEATLYFETAADRRLKLSRSVNRPPYVLAVATDTIIGAVPASIYFDTASSDQLAALQRELVEELADKQKQLAAMADKAEREVALLRAQITELGQQAAVARNIAAEKAEEIALIYASSSWRVTRVFRMAKAMITKLTGSGSRAKPRPPPAGAARRP